MITIVIKHLNFMKKYLLSTTLVLVLLISSSCRDHKIEEKSSTVTEAPYLEGPAEEFENEPPASTEGDSFISGIKDNPVDFVPEKYVLTEKIFGDLNKDGVEDCVVIIKGTNKGKFVTDESRGVLDRNRRGIIVLFSKDVRYELASRNYNCFSSENEDGGIYFAPELSVEVNKNKLYVSYGHGRYGYWKYTFRYQNLDFELIGYDRAEHRGSTVQSETSINFLTKTKIFNDNTNKQDDYADVVFEKTENNIFNEQLIKLSKIKDFDKLDVEEE